MTDDEFWSLIGVLGGVADAESVACLDDKLAELRAAEAEDFQRRLVAAVAALDGTRFAMLPVREVSDPDGAEPVPLMGDALGAFLIAVVAAGREVYEASRADPASVTARAWSFGEADHLDVAEGALVDGWIQATASSGNGTVLDTYAAAVDEIVAALNADPVWQRWWAPAGADHLEVFIFLADEDTGRIRRRRNAVLADFDLPLARLMHRPPGFLAWTAAADVGRILGQVGKKLRLGPALEAPMPANAVAESPERIERAARLAALRRKFS